MFNKCILKSIQKININLKKISYFNYKKNGKYYI